MLIKPWNYEKEENIKREYPLIVTLHGATSRTDEYYSPVIVGNDNQMKTYPCFLMAPNNPSGWGDEAAWVREQIEDLKRNYRIDNNRIYLVGFSMGGSGSYLFAESYYRDYGQLFAAIIRVAGNSDYELSTSLSLKTSVWYHIGWRDDKKRVETARNAYNFIKEIYASAGPIEKINFGFSGKQFCITKTLILNSVEIMKLSEYPFMGHNGYTPLENPGVLEWLFSQSLSDR